MDRHILVNVHCGVLLGDGCGIKLQPVITEFVGTTFRGGKMVDVYKALEPFTCPGCGKISEYVYMPCHGSLAIKRQEAELIERM